MGNTDKGRLFFNKRHPAQKDVVWEKLPNSVKEYYQKVAEDKFEQWKAKEGR